MLKRPQDQGWTEDLAMVQAIDILHLNCNLGHQRAIAVGLSHLASGGDFDSVVVMDSDGEDKPEDLLKLLAEYILNPEQIYVARRGKRLEGRYFKMGYWAYRQLFKVLVGQHVQFGNFSLLPKKYVRQLVYKETLWNHFPATLLRSNLAVTKIIAHRGIRYAGSSKMNFSALVLLGVSAISVYSDVVVLRTIIATLSSVSVVIGISVVSWFSGFMFPGWAVHVMWLLVILLIQLLIICILILMLVLSNRSQRAFIPAKNFSDFVLGIEKYYQAELGINSD